MVAYRLPAIARLIKLNTLISAVLPHIHEGASTFRYSLGQPLVTYEHGISSLIISYLLVAVSEKSGDIRPLNKLL